MPKWFEFDYVIEEKDEDDIEKLLADQDESRVEAAPRPPSTGEILAELWRLVRGRPTWIRR
jgi:hypothetical protein